MNRLAFAKYLRLIWRKLPGVIRDFFIFFLNRILLARYSFRGSIVYIDLLKVLIYGEKFSNKRFVCIKNQAFTDYKTLDQSMITLRVALTAHVFREEFIDTLIQALGNIPIKFSALITVSSVELKTNVSSRISKISNLSDIEIIVSKNYGRNFGPLLSNFSKLLLNEFDVFLHIHSKESKNRPKVNNWGKYLTNCLAGNPRSITEILSIFQSNPGVGVIYPVTYPNLELVSKWEDFEFDLNRIFSRFNLDIDLNDHFDYPAGGMFWVRTEAIRNILNFDYLEDSFMLEDNQTIKYQSPEIFLLPWIIERLIGIEPGINGFRTVFIEDKGYSSENSRSAGIKLRDYFWDRLLVRNIH